MAEYTLHYFDVPGAAEPIRLAFAVSGKYLAEWLDIRYTPDSIAFQGYVDSIRSYLFLVAYES